MDRLTELRDTVAFLQAELEAIHTGAADRSLTDDENLRFTEGEFVRNAAIAEGIELEARAASIAAVRSGDLTVLESGDSVRSTSGLQFKRDADPFDGLDNLRSLPPARQTIEYRGRALKAIEAAPYAEDRHAESAAAMVERGDINGERAKYIVEHDGPEYVEAFHKYVRHPERGVGAALYGVSERAAWSLTGANGGLAVPQFLDPTIILTNNGATNPFRGIADVKSITVDQWDGLSSAGVTAEWIAEATEVADATPTFSGPTISVHKADAYIQGSIEVVADSALSGEVGMLIADAKDRLEATAFATGSGSGQPFGIVTALGLTTASRVAGSSGAAGAADFVIGDIYATAAALPPRYRPNSSWVAEYGTQLDIRQFATGSGPSHAFWADLGVDTPSQLLGRPIYESSAMDTTVVSGSNDDVLIIGDFKAGYKIIDRMGLEMVYNPLVLGSNRRPTGEVGWVAFWRVGADSVDDNAFRMLRL